MMYALQSKKTIKQWILASKHKRSLCNVGDLGALTTTSGDSSKEGNEVLNGRWDSL